MFTAVHCLPCKRYFLPVYFLDNVSCAFCWFSQGNLCSSLFFFKLSHQIERFVNRDLKSERVVVPVCCFSQHVSFINIQIIYNFIIFFCCPVSCFSYYFTYIGFTNHLIFFCLRFKLKIIHCRLQTLCICISMSK